MLLRAVRGDLVDMGTNTASSDPQHDIDVDAMKFEEGDTRRITISPDGDIVDADVVHGVRMATDRPAGNVIEGRFPTSTLAAMQTRPISVDEKTAAPSKEPSEHPMRRSARRRRVAVDGPDDIGLDLRLLSLAVAAGCPDGDIELALADMLNTPEPSVRMAAFDAVAQRSEEMTLSPDLITLLIPALEDPDPTIRGYASRAVAACDPDAAAHLVVLLDDPDAIVRATALKAVAVSNPDRLLISFQDDSPLVRRVALDVALEATQPSIIESTINICVQESRSDTLAEACKRSPEASHILVSTLGGGGLSTQQTQAALDAIAFTE